MLWRINTSLLVTCKLMNRESKGEILFYLIDERELLVSNLHLGYLFEKEILMV